MACMRTKFNPKPLIITVVAILLIGGGVGFFLSKQAANPANTNSDSSSQDSSSVALETEEITTDSFSYTKPKDWAKLAKERLDASAAISGIGLPASDITKLPVAFITMRVVDATPVNDDDLKTSTTKELEKLTSFKLVSFADSTIDNNSGKRFIYTFEDQEKQKNKQQLDVLVHNNKTYFILYSAKEEAFDEHIADHNAVLDSLKFK